jgi:hypothetical protein
VCSGPQGGWRILIRSDMSGMRVLSGLRASVETFPMWWAFPTAESSARYDSSHAYGGLSLGSYFSASLSRGPQRCAGSSLVPCPGFPCRASGAVDHIPTFSTGGTSGASHVLRRLSSCMPRPEDSGGPAPPCQDGGASMAFGSVKTLGVRDRHVDAVPALQGTRLPLRPPGCSVDASSIVFARVEPPTPPWTQDSIRVGG